MDLEFTGKTALVTGASSGIGADTARILAEEGADVVVVYGRDRDGAQRTAATVEAQGRRAWLLAMDVAEPNSVAAAFEQLSGMIEGLDIVIICAGTNVITPLAEISPAEWDHVLGVNLSGAFFTAQAALPLLREGSSIVNVASVAAHTGAPQHIHYAAAKAGLVNLTKSLARGLGPKTRVNCVAPGMTLTPMGADAAAAQAPTYAKDKLLVQRFATPDEIARCIVFVASPVTGFMTGATIDINGGRDLR
jgi:3-oxoacyl-[acyl-carrier protein] reductase